MKKTVITMNSLTLALKARSFLSEYSIPTEVIRLNGDLTKSGCSYGITFDDRFTRNVLSLLRDNNFHYSMLSK